MAYTPRNWYQHLQEQSKTRPLHPLIPEEWAGSWVPGHDLDFVVLRTGDLPEMMREAMPISHISKSLKHVHYCFPEEDYVILHADNLNPYLISARWTEIVKDAQGREFIELKYRSKNKVDHHEESW